MNLGIGSHSRYFLVFLALLADIFVMLFLDVPHWSATATGANHGCIYGVRINRLTSSRSELEGRVEAALTDAALWSEVKDRLKSSALGLSGGQQQRLCIARALAIRPEVILMDEPASALDPIATSKIEELIFDLKKRYTIAIVTHNMQQAARVSDLTAFFLLGKLVEVNTTEKMFTAPDEKLTEDYITGRFG